MRQITVASRVSQESSHTVPQVPLSRISTRPSSALIEPLRSTRRIETSSVSFQRNHHGGTGVVIPVRRTEALTMRAYKNVCTVRSCPAGCLFCADDPSVLVVSAVVSSPTVVPALLNVLLIASAGHIVQPNCTTAPTIPSTGNRTGVTDTEVEM